MDLGKGNEGPMEQRISDSATHASQLSTLQRLPPTLYALNLNTGNAYRELRLKRAELRRQNLHISGTVLAPTLLRYSERGQAYVDDLNRLIRQNELDAVDDANLRHMGVIHIVPAGPASE